MQLETAQLQDMFRQRLLANLPALNDALRQACHLPLDVWPEDRLQAHTREGIELALKHGMSSGEDVMGWLSLRHSVSERFHEFPAVRDHLARTDLPPANRMHHMFQALPLGIWSIIRRRLPNPWYAPSQAGPDDPEHGAAAEDDYWSRLPRGPEAGGR